MEEICRWKEKARRGFEEIRLHAEAWDEVESSTQIVPQNAQDKVKARLWGGCGGEGSSTGLDLEEDNSTHTDSRSPKENQSAKRRGRGGEESSAGIELKEDKSTLIDPRSPKEIQKDKRRGVRAEGFSTRANVREDDSTQTDQCSPREIERASGLGRKEERWSTTIDWNKS